MTSLTLAKGDFYSRPYARGDAYFKLRANSRSSISTHAPTRGATRNTERITTINLKFLLTPLREGRHNEAWYDLRSRPISTHAPTRGATCCNHRQAFDYKVNFYSRPYARGDYFAFPLLRDDLHFYSRPYARGDSNYPQNACCILRQIAEKTYNFRR